MAANTRITYNVGLQVDTKNAKQAMNDLLTSVRKISTTSTEVFDTRSLKEGVNAAKDLEKALRSAFNVSTGNLNLQQFSSEMNKAGMSVEDLRVKLNNFGPSGVAAFNQLSASVASAQLPLKQTNAMIDNLLINLKKTAQWQISSTIIHGVVGQIESAIGYVRNLNKSLTDIAIVSDLSSAQLSKFAADAQKLGKSLSASTLDVTNAALIYFQQGDSVLQSMEKAAITIKAANASANSSAAEMSEYLTAIWNSYKVGSGELETYVDMMAALGAKTASSMEEIATAMQKVAATANTVGVGFDQMSSIISTVSSVTRESAESIGTSYKTILARIGDLKLGDVVEDGVTVTLGSVSKELQKIGVNILDANGEMRDMGTVIEEIGAKWQGMNNAQKAAVAQTIAGKRQYTQLMALFENWDKYQNNMSITENSDGALDEMQNKWAEGWEAASNRVRNSMEGIYSALINDKFVTGFLNVIAEVVGGVNSMVDAFGGLGPVLTMLGGVMMTKFGDRTSEILKSIKTNLGLITGSTQKAMIKQQQDFAATAEKQEQSATTIEGKMAARHSGRVNKANAAYNANSNHMSMEQRQNYQMHLEALQQKQNEELALAQQGAALKKQESSLTANTSKAYDVNKAQKESLGDTSELDTLTSELEAIAQRKNALTAELHALGDSPEGEDSEQAEHIRQQLENLTNAQQSLQEQQATLIGESTTQANLALREQLEQAGITDLDALITDEGAIVGEAKTLGERIGAALTSALKQNTAQAGKLEYFTNLSNSAKKSAEEIQEQMKKVSESDASDSDKTEQNKKLTEQMRESVSAAMEALGGSDSANADAFQNALQQIKAEGSDLAGTLTEVDGVLSFDTASMSADQLVAAISEVNTKLAEMQQNAENAANAAEDALSAGGAGSQATALRNNISEQGENEDAQKENSAEIEGLQEDLEVDTTPVLAASDALVKMAGSAMQVVSAVQSVGAAWQTLNDADATPIEKTTAVLTSLMMTLTALKSVEEGYAAAKSLWSKIEVGYAALKERLAQKSIKAQLSEIAVKNKAMLTSLKEATIDKLVLGVKSLINAVREKGILLTIKNIGLTILETVAKTALSVVEMILAALTGNWVGLAAAAAIAVAAVTVAVIASTAAKKKEVEALQEESKALSENSNELAKAQKENMSVLASLSSVIQDTTLTMEEQLEKINELTSAYGVQATALDVLSGKYGRLQAEMNNALSAEQQNITAGLESNLEAKIANADALIESEMGFGDGKNAWFGHAQNGVLKKWDDTSISQREADWLMDSNIDFSAFGMTLNENGQLASRRDLTAEDYRALYSALQKAGVDQQNFGSDSYIGKMLSTMENDWDLDGIDRIEDQLESARWFEGIVGRYAEDFDALNTKGGERSLEDLYNLIDTTGATSQAQIANVAEYAAQFGHWDEAALQLQGVEELAAEAANLYNLKQEDVSKAFRQQIEGGMSVDTLLKINPVDIIFNPDGSIQDIRDEAEAQAQAQTDKAEAIEVQAKVAAVSEYADKDTLTRQDYEAIADTGLFTDEELNAFTTSSPAARALMLEQKQREAEEQELEALRIETAKAKELELQYREEYQAYIDGLKESLQGTDLADDFGDLEGEELYKAMIARRNQLEEEMAFIDQYSTTTIDDDTDEDTAAAYKKAALAAMSDEDYKTYYNADAQTIYENWGKNYAATYDYGTASGDVEAMNVALAQGELLWGGINDQVAIYTAGMDDIEAAEWWQNTGKAMAEATAGAEAFGKAIGKMGKMSGEDLAALQQLDANALSNYQTMSSEEWDAYAYEQAMAYYSQMEELYANDAYMLAQITQEKETTQETYYNNLKTKAEASAKYLEEKAKEEAEAIKNALASLNDIDFEEGLSSLGEVGLEKLRQELMAVYNDAELVDAMIRNIGKEESGSKEAALALADAKMALGLKSHSALVAKQQEASSILSYSAEVETIEPPLYNDDGVLKFKTESGEILTQIKGLPDGIFINEKGELVQLDPQTGTYNILGDAASSVFLTADGKLKVVDPVNGTYHIIDDAKNAEFFNDNGTLKVRTSQGTYVVRDINATDFFTDKGVLPGKNADGTYTITADNQTTFFDSQTGALKSDLNGAGKYTVTATSGNKEVFLEEGGVLSLASFENGQAHFVASISDAAGDGTPGTLSVSNGVISISSVTAEGTITAGLQEGSYKGIKANADGTITIDGIDPNSPQGTAFLEVAAQEGLGITITGEGEDASITLSGFTMPTIDPLSVSAEAGAGVSGTGTEADPFTPNIDTSDKYQTIHVNYMEENYDKVNDKIYQWGKRNQSDIITLEGTGFVNGKSDTRNTLDDIGGGQLASALNYANMYYGGDFLRMYKENVSMRDVAREGTRGLSEEVTSWYNLAYQKYLDQFNGDVEQANTAIQNEIANMGENSGVQLLFDMMEAEMSLGSSGDVVSLFQGYTDINGREVSAEESVSRMIDLWLSSFEGSLHDGTLESSAVFLIQGLVQGLQGNTDMLAKVAQMLGYTTIEEMNHALGIASPSKYTMEMGYWLIAGLSKGFQEAEFDPGDFGTAVLNRIKDQIKDIDMAEIWSEMGFGFEDLTESEFATAVANGTLNDTQKAQVLKNWNDANTENTYETYDDLVASGADLNAYRTGVKSTVVTSRASVMEKLGGRTTQDTDGSWIIEAYNAETDKWEKIEGLSYDTEAAAQDAFVASEYAAEKTAEYLDGGFWADDSLNSAQKMIMDEIVSSAVEAVSDGKFTDVSEYLSNGGSLEELTPYLNESYANYQTELNNAVDLSWAQIKDTWISTLKECQEYDEQAAQDTYDRWIKLWDEVGKARIAAIKGEDGVSLADSLSKEGKQLMIGEILGDEYTSLTDADLANMRGRMRGNVGDASDLLTLDSYASSGFSETGFQYGLNHDSENFITATTVGEFQTNVETHRRNQVRQNMEDTNFWTAWGSDGAQFASMAQMAANADGTFKSFDEMSASLQEMFPEFDTDALMQIYSQMLGLIDGGVLSKNTESGLYEATTLDTNQIVNAVAAVGLPTTAEGWASLYRQTAQEGLADEEDYLSTYKTQKTNEYNAELDNIETMQGLVQQAMENGWDSLSPENRDILSDYMEEQGWETLEQANTGLANKADEVTAALEGMRAALAKGYVPDGDGGYVDPTQVSTTTTGTLSGENAASQAAAINENSAYTYQADTATYTRERAIDNGDGTYTLVTDTVSKDAYMSEDSIGEDYNQGYNTQAAIEYNVQHRLDGASDQFTALNNMWDYDQGTDEWSQGIDDLSNAYEGIEGAQEIIDKLKDGTLGLADANEQLCSITMETGDNIEEMTDDQYDQWKQMLRNNKVTVKGYKTLDDYFASCDKGRKISKKMAKATEDFIDAMDDAGTEANNLIKELDKFEDVDLDGVMDPEETGWDELMDTLVPEEFQGITDELLNVWTQFGGDWDAAIRAGFDQTTGAFNDSTIQLLTAMGLNADQIKALQDQTKQALADGAAMGDINFLSMIADMDVDNVPFDSMIESLNSAMRQIYAAAAKMGIDLIPATWQDIPTLASKGVGAHGGNNGGGGGKGNNSSTQKPDTGGGGGGGGGDPQQKDKKEYDDEIERYHEIQEEITRTGEVLSQLEKKKERAYGKKYLDLMDQEIEKLKENIEEQQRYQDEIAGYLAQDRQAAAALGAQFDAEGNITNYTAVMQSIIDDYNAAVEQYNAGNMTDEQFEDIEEQYEDAVEALEQYEETLALSAEAQEEFLELQNQLSEANLEKITYKIEIVTELNEGDLEILEYYQEMYEDNLDKQDDLMRNLTQQAKEYESNVLVLNEAMAELQAKFAAGEINEADFAEGMQTLREQAVEYASELEDLKDQIVEVYSDALDLAAEQVENFTEKMQDSADMMDTYISLTQLMGRGTNYRDLEKFYETQYKANLANLETQRAYVDELERQAAYFEDQIAAGIELTEVEQEQYEALQDSLREANQELASTTEAALQSVQAAYENSINAIFKELDESIAGTAGSLADLADQYSYYQEQQTRYVSTAKELYEVSKLNRSIEQSLEDATTSASKAKLKALQDEINLISEKNDLSEYDIEMMNLQYQLTLAQIALEEAQASKDTVRLTRDQDGNMAYQYTANQEKVSKAQQEYENVLQSINELASNRVSELEQQCLTAEQQYLQSAQEILLDTTLTDEQRTQKLEELSARYSETLLYIQSQYNNASQALTTNQQAVAEHYGQALVNSMGQASTQMNEVMANMIANAQEHIQAFDQALFGDSASALSEYLTSIGALTTASGLTYDNLTANAETYAAVAATANEQAQALIDTFADSFDDINEATEEWDAHLAVLEGVQAMYENIATSAQHTLDVLSGFSAGEGVGDTTAAVAALLGLPVTTNTNVPTQNTETAKTVADKKISVDDNALVAVPEAAMVAELEAYQEMSLALIEEFNEGLISYEELSSQQLKLKQEELEAMKMALGVYEEASNKIGGGGGGNRKAEIEQILTEAEYASIQHVFDSQLQAIYAEQEHLMSTITGAQMTPTVIEQHIEINAEFPDVSEYNEIKLAFDDLINLATQHAYGSSAVQKS